MKQAYLTLGKTTGNISLNNQSKKTDFLRIQKDPQSLEYREKYIVSQKMTKY